MKRYNPFRSTFLPILAVLVLTVLPNPVQAQSREAMEKQEQALRELEERLAQIQEEFARSSGSEAEALARYEEVLAELQATRGMQVQELRARAEQMEQERLVRAEEMEQELRARAEHMEQEHLVRAREMEQELRARAELLEQERRVRTEDARRRAESLAVRVRDFSRQDRERLERRVQEVAQQVRIRVRSRARLGVSLDGSQGEEFDRQGARIMGVTEESPAAQAGIHVGDIITHLDGHSLLDPIPDEDDLEFGESTSLPVQRLMALAREMEEGQEVEVRYTRDGDARTVTLEAAEINQNWVSIGPGNLRRGVYRVGPEGSVQWRYSQGDEDFRVQVLPHLEDLHLEMPEIEFEDFQFDTLRSWNVFKGDAPNIRFFRGEGEPDLAFFRGGDNFAFSIMEDRVFGLELREINPDLGEYFSTEEGVLVLEVSEDSPLGLLAGDVILSIGDREVQDTGDVSRILRSYEDEETVTFRVMRQGQETRVEGVIG